MAFGGSQFRPAGLCSVSPVPIEPFDILRRVQFLQPIPEHGIIDVKADGDAGLQGGVKDSRESNSRTCSSALSKASGPTINPSRRLLVPSASIRSRKLEMTSRKSFGGGGNNVAHYLPNPMSLCRVWKAKISRVIVGEGAVR